MLCQLFADESGFIISSELVLIATVLVIGLVVGNTTLRDQVVTELADVADAVSALDQSFAYSSVTGHSSSTAGTSFDDSADFCDLSDNGQQGIDAFGGTCVIVMNLPSVREEDQTGVVGGGG